MGNTGQLNQSLARTIRVLVVEDSATVRHHLVTMIQEWPLMQVVGQARDGAEALALLLELKPDVISMDIRMPRMDGLEATRHIMALQPTPVVIVSGLVKKDVEMSFQAIEAGAVAVVEKPPDRHNPQFAEKQLQLLRTLKAMAGVSVVRRTPYKNVDTGSLTEIIPEIIAIGASAGGPSALSTFLGAFPAQLPVPIVLVQHMPEEFISGLARWLGKNTPLPVKIATDGHVLEPGVVNLSPGTVHLQIKRRGQALVTHFLTEQGTHRYIPSVDVLFQSVAAVCGAQAVGVVLTGMGDDGAAGLLAMRQAGARTFAQDQASSTVFGMPNAAIELGAVQKVLPLADLPPAILKLL